VERKAKLAEIVRGKGVHYVEHIDASGPELFRNACALGIEGVVSKWADAPYRSGRSKNWIKVKNRAAPGMTRFNDDG
jgi:ATP-dependent DNA ligase